MHFAEGTLMLHLMARLYLARAGGEGTAPVLTRVEGLLADELAFIEAELGRSAHLAGEEFSAADVQMTFPLEFATYCGVVGERHARVRDFLARMQARTAYRRAVTEGGAYLFDPASAPDASPFPLPKR
jgi:glutathione S-transferase